MEGAERKGRQRVPQECGHSRREEKVGDVCGCEGPGVGDAEGRSGCGCEGPTWVCMEVSGK